MAEKSRTFEVRMERIEFLTKGAGGNRGDPVPVDTIP